MDQENRKKAEKIMCLVKEIAKDPFNGTGKPEPLKHSLAGCWSRRIDQENRLVYSVSDQKFESFPVVFIISQVCF